jgi:hypothetical protein
MLDVTITANITGIKAAQKKMAMIVSMRKLAPVLEETKNSILDILRKATPVSNYRSDRRAGGLKAGWMAKTETDEVGGVAKVSFFNVDTRQDKNKILQILVRGARPHRIVPRRAKLLAFIGKKDNKKVIQEFVNHPGSRPVIPSSTFDAIAAQLNDLKAKMLEVR